MQARIWTIIGLCAFGVSGCEFMPGTQAYEVAQAKRSVAELLLDPASAKFRNVSVRNGHVCGEINGQNRMGAFVGFSQFVVSLDGSEPVIDPEFDYGDLVDAEASCRSLAGNEYASYSTQLSVCERAVEKRAEANLQARFEELWQKHCSFGNRSAVYRPPLGDSGTPSKLQADETTPDATEESDASGDDWYDGEDGDAGTSPVVDEYGNPIAAPPTSESGDQASQRPDSGLNQRWLDGVLGRSSQPERPPAQQGPPATEPPDPD